MSAESKEPIPRKRIVRSRPAAPGMTSAAAETERAAPASLAPEPANEAARAAAPAEKASEKVTAADSGAALAQAVAGARKDALRPQGSANPRPTPTAFRARALLGQPLAYAAAILLALGGGFAGAQALMSAGSETKAASARMTETAQNLARSQQDVLRLSGDLKALKVAVESLKDSVDKSKADLAGRQAQLERAERGSGERLTRIAEGLERVEAAAKEPVAKIGSLSERFERLERQITTVQAAAATSVPAAPEPVQTGTVEPKPAPKEPPKDVALEGWTLHEVYDGVALIEGRNRRLYEVGRGGVIPGVGPVESIERRNKRWVVVTPKGYIGG